MLVEIEKHQFDPFDDPSGRKMSLAHFHQSCELCQPPSPRSSSAKIEIVHISDDIIIWNDEMEILNLFSIWQTFETW